MAGLRCAGALVWRLGRTLTASPLQGRLTPCPPGLDCELRCRPCRCTMQVGAAPWVNIQFLGSSLTFMMVRSR